MSRDEWVDVMRSKDAARIRSYFTASNVNTHDELGRTPLLLACGGGIPDNADVVAHLLDCGADIDAQNEDGWTALHYAACNGKLNCLRVLLSWRADIDVQTHYGCTPLAMTLKYEHHECATLLLLDWGAQLSQVRHHVHVPSWAPAYVAGRERARMAAVVLLVSRRKQRSTVMASNAMDVIRMIAKIVWSTRGDEAWQENTSPKKKLNK